MHSPFPARHDGADPTKSRITYNHNHILKPATQLPPNSIYNPWITRRHSTDVLLK